MMFFYSSLCVHALVGTPFTGKNDHVEETEGYAPTCGDRLNQLDRLDLGVLEPPNPLFNKPRCL